MKIICSHGYIVQIAVKLLELYEVDTQAQRQIRRDNTHDNFYVLMDIAKVITTETWLEGLHKKIWL